MIKRHKNTGLKYFCKTTKADPVKYKGSGVRWSNHLAVHGRDVENLWCELFTDKAQLIEYAINFSIKNNIVDSDEWANLVIEDGITGFPPGSKHRIETIEKCRKNANGFKKGYTPHNKGIAEPSDKKEKRMASIQKYRDNNPGWDNGWQEGKKKHEAKRLAACSKQTEVNGVLYSSATEASRKLGIKKITLIKRVKGPNFPTYNYVQKT